MKNMRRLIGTTMIGGVIFLIPLVFIVVIVGKAVQIMKSVAVPLAKFVPVDSVAGVAIVPILATLITIFSCLVAGMLARSPVGRKAYQKFDTVLLQLIPVYAWVKGITGGISDDEAEAVLKPVMVKFDDQAQLAFEVDRAENGLVAVYVPGAPDPRSGSVSYVSSDRVQPVNADFKAITRVCKNLGRGSATVFSSQKD